MERSLGQGLYFKNNWNTEYNQHQSRDVSMYDSIDANPDNSAPIIEGMTNISNTTKEINKKMELFKEKYNEFKKTKNEVNETRQKYLEVLRRNVALPDDVQEYLNSVVKHGSKYYYINRFGYRREFINDNNIDVNTCGVPGVDHPHRDEFNSFFSFWDSGREENTEIINKETKVPYKGDIPSKVFNKLQNGTPMFDKAPCGYEGKVIQGGAKTDLFAWIDSEGVRHKFGDVMDWKENKSCPQNLEVVTTSQFNSFTIGEEMTDDDKCSTFVDNPGLRSELILKTGKLQDITEDLLNNYTSLIEEDEKFMKELEETRKDFYKILNELNNKTQKDNELQKQQNTLKTRWENTVIEERQQYYLYGGGLVLTVLLGGFAFYHASRSS